ncbi:helix-turn-helix domain-containing protein [Cryptosporangium aurantiacum]|uniref:Transcriptional regulator, contains XRE-family HTH domain n=1 Tax=Cryptosporangium aurantiacum TaxID=134849 RepID=A0A1M7NDD3_9ACTN|nr:helix-turn-helix transcriptional regulator [Cryptosporangium aurantiacum]SHN01656.1 Transcriptional regulator, contains XRE-family HTH domain [Cryptosporangium aurantiacum]
MTSLKSPQDAVRTLGEFIREQRAGSQISLRQLAKQAGISNPYLSQIERGLRKPSAEILQQIAKALRISAETLYVHAGLLDRETLDGVEGLRTDGALGATASAITADEYLTERQKQILLEIYHSFRRENEATATSPGHAEETTTGFSQS